MKQNRLLSAAGVVIAMVTGGLAGASFGQVVPPAPAKTPATPEYTPPPPPQAPKPITPPRTDNTGAGAQTPEGDQPLPSLVEKDSAGKIKPLKYPTEEAALRLLDLDPETKKKVDAAMQARRLDIGRAIYDKVEDLMDVKKALDEATEKDTLERFTEAGRKAQSFKGFNNLLDRLMRDGAITSVQKAQATKIAREYKTAVGKEIAESTGHTNVQAMMLAGFKASVGDFMADAFKELNQLMADAAPKASDILKGMNLPASSPAAAHAAELSKKTGDARVEAVKSIFVNDLNNDQRRAFLKSVNPALAERKNDKADDKKPEGQK